MAEADTNNSTPVSTSKNESYSNHFECTNYPKFINFGWETLYKTNMTNMIKVIDIYKDISRLYLLIKLDLSDNILINTMITLCADRLNKFPDAISLTNNLKDILPDADPIYLDIVGEMYTFDHNSLFELIELITTKKRSYPKFQEYNDHIKDMNIINSLTTEFNVQDFLCICPDPVNYFKNIKINSSTTHYNESISYLSDNFNRFPINSIRTILKTNNYNLTNTVKSLNDCSTHQMLKNKRKSFSHQVDFRLTDNIEFLKEVAYLEHKDEILNHIESRKTIHKVMVEEAKSVGKLCTCQCCYNDELLDTEVHSCSAGHLFCSSCIKKGVEVAVGANKLDFKCFVDCTEELNLTIIKKVVDEKLFQRIIRLIQTQEILAADIEGLETCAFCEYSVILSPDMKIINCLNPECKKETCRECREENHLPFKCDQIEKSAEVKVRTMIENKMTEVLIRTCYNCKKKFVKDDGCNKMTCSCGKQMCYICRKPVSNDYAHFYHNALMKDKCPLYTDETIVHTTAVEAAARLIINELKEKQPELLRNIDIDKILPSLNKTKKKRDAHVSALDVNRVVALVTGQNLEDINNLKDMRSLEPRGPKTKRAKR